MFRKLILLFSRILLLFSTDPRPCPRQGHNLFFLGRLDPCHTSTCCTITIIWHLTRTVIIASMVASSTHRNNLFSAIQCWHLVSWLHVYRLTGYDRDTWAELDRHTGHKDRPRKILLGPPHHVLVQTTQTSRTKDNRCLQVKNAFLVSRVADVIS